MKKRIKIDLYGNHFMITVYDRTLDQYIDNYINELTSYTYRYNYRTKRNERVPDRLYGVAKREEGVYRFTNRILKPILGTMGQLGNLTSDEIELVKHTVEQGLPIDIKFKDNKFKARDYQEEYIEQLLANKMDTLLVDLSMGLGKLIEDNTLVRIPNGWTKIKDIKVDDLVMTQDGSYTKVTGVYPQGKKDIYTVTFEDGRTILAGLEHQWSISVDNEVKTSNTEEMIKLLRKGRVVNIPLCKPEDNKPIYTTIHPYIQGILYNSFREDNNCYLISLYSNDDFNKFTDLVKDNFNRLIIPNKQGYHFRLNIDGYMDIKEYYNASIEQKYELLRGIFTSRYAIFNKNNIVFKTRIEGYANSIRDIVFSLGDKCKLLLDKDGYYNVVIYSKSLYNYTGYNKPRVINNGYDLRVISIKKTSKDNCTCIAVEHPSKLYVIENYIVTHNTFIAMNAISKIKKKTAILILPKYIDKWTEDIHKYTYTKPERVYIVRGSDSLIWLMEHPEEAKKDYDFFIFSMRTISNYLTEYIDVPMKDYHYLKYPVEPQDLFKLLGIGVLLVDEVHQEFHNFYYSILYFTVDKVIALSATLVSDKNKMTDIHATIFPDDKRISNLVKLHKHVNLNVIKYYIDRGNKIRCESNHGYSHIKFEQYILSNSRLLKQMDTMYMKYVKRDFLDIRQSGDKLLVFCSTVDMCRHLSTVIGRHCNDNGLNLKVGTYVESDSYDDMLKLDIIVSTVISSGTAIDIPGLLTVIQTISIGSMVANIQAFGRLRRRKDGRECIYDSIYCYDINKQRGLQKRRLDSISDKCKSVNYEIYMPDLHQSVLIR